MFLTLLVSIRIIPYKARVLAAFLTIPANLVLETNPGSFPAQPGQSILSNRNVRRMVHGDYLHVSL